MGQQPRVTRKETPKRTSKINTMKNLCAFAVILACLVSGNLALKCYVGAGNAAVSLTCTTGTQCVSYMVASVKTYSCVTTGATCPGTYTALSGTNVVCCSSDNCNYGSGGNSAGFKTASMGFLSLLGVAVMSKLL